MPRVWGVPKLRATSYQLMAHSLGGVGAKGLTQDDAMTVQRDAAGSLRVSLGCLFFIFPQEWRAGG
jgi:hypothetical protein